MEDLWLFCMHMDAKQHEQEQRAYEQEVEIRTCRYMVQFYKDEITEIRRDKERLATAVDEANKRRKVEEDERANLTATITAKENEIESLRSHLMNAVRERDAAARDVQHFRGLVDQSHEARKGLRRSVRVLSNSFNGDTTREVADALGELRKHCQ